MHEHVVIVVGHTLESIRLGSFKYFWVAEDGKRIAHYLLIFLRDKSALIVSNLIISRRFGNIIIVTTSILITSQH